LALLRMLAVEALTEKGFVAIEAGHAAFRCRITMLEQAVHERGCMPTIYVQGNRPAMNRRNATLASSSLRETSARTQPANSFIVSLRFGDGLVMQIFEPFEF
jgi:hypothetical protein